jgi:HSP20 family protein
MFDLTQRKKEGNGSKAMATRPEHPLSRVRDEFESLFERFFGQLPATLGLESSFWGMDIDDTGKEIVVRADAPGFEPEDFDIKISGNMLTIEAAKKQKNDKDSFYSERRLQRSVTLPAGSDPDKVDAHYRNGVLELHIAKAPEAQAKRIEVKGARTSR